MLPIGKRNDTGFDGRRMVLFFGFPLVLTLLMTPSVIRLAGKYGCIDHPGGRKATAIHPTMGRTGLFRWSPSHLFFHTAR